MSPDNHDSIKDSWRAEQAKLKKLLIIGNDIDWVLPTSEQQRVRVFGILPIIRRLLMDTSFRMLAAGNLWSGLEAWTSVSFLRRNVSALDPLMIPTTTLSSNTMSWSQREGLPL